MDAAIEQRVRERAYEIWLAAGMEGAADSHWLSAEHAVMSETGGTAPKRVAASKRSVMDRVVAVKASASKAGVSKTGATKAGARTAAAPRKAAKAEKPVAHA